MNYLKTLMKKETKWADVWHFLIGHYRFRLYYSKYFRWLLRWHIKEQIAFRMCYIPDKCYNDGSCQKCGCQVPHLQMAAKSCEGLCYPKMMDSYFWSKFMVDQAVKQDGKIWFRNSATNVVSLIVQKTHTNVPEHKPKLR